VNLRAAFLAEQALQNPDGTFMVWRGGITDFNVIQFPALIHAVMILRLEADAAEARQLHALRVRVVHDGLQAPWHESPIAFKDPQAPETTSYLNMLVNLNVGFSRPGTGRIEVALNVVESIPPLVFAVKQAAVPPVLPLR
jgi:hypothetical protein